MAKILIVDDEPHIRLLLEQTLEDFYDEGVDILLASNGTQALETILRERPEMVFLDVMMPGMDGFEVCSKVKSMDASAVYIALLTAKGQEFDKQKGLAAGADLYITKPFNPDEIIRIARSIVG